jgi:hypothetical protein
MSLAPMIGESVWLAKEKTYGKKYLWEWSNVIWVDSFLITNNKV